MILNSEEKKDNGSYSKKIALLGMLLCVSLILSYLESLIPINGAIPGMKIGLANIVTIIVLYKYGYKEAFVIGITRVVISGFMFSGLSTIIYGIAGTVFSIFTMMFAQKIIKLAIVGTSVIGGMFHNIGQIIVGAIVIENASIFYYLPILLISGLVTGMLVGFVSGIIYNSLKKAEIS